MSISLIAWLWPTLGALLLLMLMSRYNKAWQRRRVLAEAVIALTLASVPFLFTSDYPLLLQLVLMAMQSWVILLAGRLLFGRLPEELLRSSTHFNSVLGLAIFLVVTDAWLGAKMLGFDSLSYRSIAMVLLLVSVVVAMLFLYQIFWTLKHYRLRKLDEHLSLKQLPTVTLAIPARNETHALAECLQAAIASDYPKLEILVLDDCSQDKTSQIIRAYAHDGVRFVQGSDPADGWLGKNQALRTLAQEALGDFIVFADVDTHVDVQSITRLVKYALSNELDMVSVLPQRRDGLSTATLLQQLRYYWQVALPVTNRRVPVASQCWLIRRKTLKKLGGFESVSQKIVPEGSFARKLFAEDRYRFIISNHEVGVSTAKKWSSQIETGVRFLYPTFKRQPFLVLFGCLLLLGVMLLPFAVLLMAPSDPALFIAALVACSVLWLGYVLVVIRTHPRTWMLSVLCLPLSLVQEVLLLLGSMLTYEFGDVNWKGRNVCYAVITRSRLK